MEFKELLQLVGSEPVFESSLLLSGNINPQAVRLQLSRWVKNGRINQLRRGLYVLAPPYQKTQPHPFHVANQLQQASYVSLQSALAYYGLIPETVTLTTSVSTGRPEKLETPLGNFEFHHLKTELLFGYQMVDLGGESALVASPEKALLDLIYLQPEAGTAQYLGELRLHNTGLLDLDRLKNQAGRFNPTKMYRAYSSLSRLVLGETREYENL